MKKIIGPLIIIVIAALGLAAYLNRVYLSDWLSANSFAAPAEIVEIEDKIALTNRGSLIFNASHPALESQDDFNTNCNSHDREISVLGCYGAGRIHVYDIKNQELNGVIESTAAHELLHAVWERLGAGEKSDLSKLLTKVYDDAKYHDLLAEDLDTYEEKDRIEELHSRVGTEIADLPDELEAHYAKYFENQDLIVDFYSNYITPFRELSEEIEALGQELEALDAEIEDKTEDYYRAAEALNTKIGEFNRCASSGCFATDTAFDARRAELVKEQAEVEDMYEELSDLIDDYNLLVAEYNANVLRGEALENAINSNANMEEIN